MYKLKQEEDHIKIKLFPLKNLIEDIELYGMKEE